MVLLVYVKKKCIEVESIRKNMLQYIGGQTNVLCRHHFVPLIILSPTIEMVCRQINKKDTSSFCGNKVLYGCPHIQCSACLCKSCFTKFSKEELYYIRLTCPWVQSTETLFTNNSINCS